MGFKTKVQLIQRKDSQQFYINFPSACAQMMGLSKGEVVEWVLTDDGDLLLKRTERNNGAHGTGELTTTKQPKRQKADAPVSKCGAGN